MTEAERTIRAIRENWLGLTDRRFLGPWEWRWKPLPFNEKETA